VSKLKYPIRASLVLTRVTQEEALKHYCHGVAVFVDYTENVKEGDANLSVHKKEQLTPSGDYGSHATAEELFHRSVSAIFGYSNNTEKKFYANIKPEESN